MKTSENAGVLVQKPVKSHILPSRKGKPDLLSQLLQSLPIAYYKFADLEDHWRIFLKSQAVLVLSSLAIKASFRPIVLYL